MKKIFMSIILILTLTSCFDSIPIENRSFVIDMGIDLNDAGEYSITTISPDINSLSKDNKEDLDNITHTGTGNTLTSAISNINSHIDKDLYFGHTKLIVLGQSLLRNKQATRQALDMLDRSRDINKKVLILAVNTQAQDIFNNNNGILGLYITDLYKTSKRKELSTHALNLETLIKNLINHDISLIPLISKNKEEVTIDSFAMLKNYELYNYINKEQSIYYMIASDELNGKNFNITTKIEDTEIPVDINKKNARYRFYEQDEQIICDINVSLTAAIDEFGLQSHTLSDDKFIKSLESQISLEIKDKINDTFNMFKNMDYDALGLIDKLKKSKPQLYAKHIDIQPMVNVDVNILFTGSIK
jgi:Ger(x)C family germination protein